MSKFFEYLRYAVRGLGHSPAFVVTVLATLGVGIGLNAAIFTVVDCVLLRPLGYHDADRIVALRTHLDEGNRSSPRMGGDDYRDLAQQVHGLEVSAYYNNGQDGVGLEGRTLYLPVAWVSPGFGGVMGVQAAAGRLFAAGDGKETDALVSAEFAREHFGSAQAALGKVLQWTGAPRTIVGVLPSGFGFPGKTMVWFEGGRYPENGNRTAYNQYAVGKRRAGVSQAQLAAELTTFSAQLRRSFPEDSRKSIESVPLKDELVGSIGPTLHLLMGAVGLILVIVCANVTHLQMVRAMQARRAVTIHAALGASRRRLAGRALTEAALLATGGGIVALLLAMGGLRVLVRLAPQDTPRLAEIQLNPDVLLFSFAASLLLMCLTAVLPVWRSWRVDPALALRHDSARSSESKGARRVRNSFLVAQVSLTLTLSIAALLLGRQLIRQAGQDLGFAAEHLVTLDTHAVLAMPAPDERDSSPAGRAAAEAAWERIHVFNLARLDAAMASIGSVPGVESVGAMAGAPMGFGGSDVSYAVEGRQVFAPGVANLPDADIRPVTPGTLAAMGVPLLRGRGLLPQDGLHSPRVVVINQALARQSFAGVDPLGQRIVCGFDENLDGRMIVGIAGDIRASSPAAAPSPTLYIPIAQHPGFAPDMQLVVRTQGDPAAMTETLRRRLLATHPDIAVRATTMREDIGETERGDAFRTILFASFAGVSIALAAVGMYGVMAYTVAQRRFEFGLRMALGSTRGQLLGLVLRSAVWMGAAGVVLGIGLSLALSRVLASVVGALPGFDAGGYGIAVGAVLVLCVGPAMWPARRAAAAAPMEALRSE